MAASGAQKLLQQGMADAQQQKAQQQMQDPLIQMQQQELRIKEQETQIKAMKAQVDAMMKAERLRLDQQKFEAGVALDAAKIVSQERQGDEDRRVQETEKMVDFIEKLNQPQQQGPVNE
jgi:hypothetical protein